MLLERIERREALGAASAQLMKEILLRQEFNEEIPAGLPPGTPVAHKTGSITGDAARRRDRLSAGPQAVRARRPHAKDPG